MLVVVIYCRGRVRSKAADGEMLWQVQESQAPHESRVANHRASTFRLLPAHVSYPQIGTHLRKPQIYYLKTSLDPGASDIDEHTARAQAHH